MNDLTTAEEKVLRYIAEAISENDYPPSVRDIQSALGYRTTSVIKKYIDRVNFTHFKDIKSSNVASAGMASAGMEVYSNFCELGKGNVDFRTIFDMLKAQGYDGPLCEELDSPPVSNEESALNNFNFLLNNY